MADGQVCDRCRAKKVKCDGGTPSCGVCERAGLPCESNTKLKRTTKIRGYARGKENLIRELQAENARLRHRLDSQSNRWSAQGDCQLQQPDSSPQSYVRTAEKGRCLPQMPFAADPGRVNEDESNLVFKHMGRLVLDRSGIGRFAGSTTGVHFIASVEQLCRRMSSDVQPLHEGCFRLHLYHKAVGEPANIFPLDINDSLTVELQILLRHPHIYYIGQLSKFLGTWAVLCPIITRAEFEAQTQRVHNVLHTSPQDMRPPDLAWLQMLLIITVINELDERTPQTSEDLPGVMSVICKLNMFVAALGDLTSLQSLALFSLYVQVSAQTSWLIHINGMMVRLAQSLGMHRHSRRFKFGPPEVELRKRLWWWVYAFDKITSIVHGIPRLINDSDVDNDLPLSCELEDLSSSELGLPLPGEPTSVSLYLCYVQLAKLLSAILDELYTTTCRRGGVEKIARLGRDLQNWKHSFSHHSRLMPSEVGDQGSIPQQSTRKSEFSMISWLQLMSNLATVLLHRPALTYEPTKPQFVDSLKVCVQSCIAILELLAEDGLRRQPYHGLPFGPSLAFQSALMLIFYCCNTRADDPAIIISRSDCKLLVTHAIQSLQSILLDNGLDPNAEDLRHAIGALSNLNYLILESTDVVSMSEPSLPPISEQVLLSDSLTSTNEDFWASNVLDNLNHLSDVDWMIGFDNL